MKNEIENNARLLEALDYIDSDLIGATADKLMKPIPAKKRFFTTRKLAIIAACLCLAVLLVPFIIKLSDVEVSISVSENDPPPPPFGMNDDTHIINTQSYDGSRGLIYRASEDGTYAILVDDGSCTDRDITVATNYNGLPVTHIKNSALSKCKTVESVTFPDTVEEIGSGVLWDCPNLKRIYIGAGVRKIGLHAFIENALEEVVISPDNPYFICKNNCVIETATKTLILGYNGATIPDDGSVEIIGYFAFSSAKGITSMIIPEGIREIRSNAFERCEFESITLPKSLEKLGSGVFIGCENLKYFDLGGYHELPDSTLSDCREIREVTGLENVTRIGRYALNVGEYLYNIRLTSALKYIDEHACSGADSLGRIYFDGTVEEWNAIPRGYKWTRLAPNIICNDGKGDYKATLPDD